MQAQGDITAAWGVWDALPKQGRYQWDLTGCPGACGAGSGGNGNSRQREACQGVTVSEASGPGQALCWGRAVSREAWLVVENKSLHASLKGKAMGLWEWGNVTS